MIKFEVGDKVKRIKEFNNPSHPFPPFDPDKVYTVRQVFELTNNIELEEYAGEHLWFNENFVLVPQIQVQDNEFVKVMREHERMLEL